MACKVAACKVVEAWAAETGEVETTAQADRAAVTMGLAADPVVEAKAVVALAARAAQGVDVADSAPVGVAEAPAEVAVHQVDAVAAATSRCLNSLIRFFR